MLPLLLTVALALLGSVDTLSNQDTPDVRLIKEVVWELWENRVEILQESLFNLEFDEEDIEMLLDEFYLVESDSAPEPEKRVDCPACMVGLGGRGLVGGGGTQFKLKLKFKDSCLFNIRI